MSSRIAVVGAGYVGLTTGVCFASLGHDVVIADVDRERIDRLNAGECPILEAGLERLMEEAVDDGHLSFVVGAAAAAAEAEFVYLCVPTPQGDDGSADLSYVTTAAAEIAPVLQPGTVVVNKSTVPVGSADLVSVVIARDDVFVVSNPEFLREGSAVHDFMNPDRIVIGCASQDAALRVSALYLGVTAPVIVTDPASAELIKYASNGFLATKLSFVNAIATLCEELGADSKDVLLGMGYDRRIGHQFLSAGPGWGGSCFPKDSQALVKIASEGGYQFSLLSEAIKANEGQLSRVTTKAKGLCGGSLEGKRVAAFGLTFKAGTDDLRDSPAVRVVKDLMAAGAHVAIYDPAFARPDRCLPADLEGVFQCATAYDAADQADLIAVLTEWPEFAELDLDKLSDRVRSRLMLDTRNVFDRSAVLRRGFRYLGTGR
jgi:UDPglucose 6-dehydrogenase